MRINGIPYMPVAVSIALTASALMNAQQRDQDSAATTTEATAPKKQVVPEQRKETDDVVVLSPFVVNQSADVGYLATSTLTGGRLDMPLRDVGASVSVLTQEFFKDTGATNGASVLSYALNMEVAGVQGNFTGGVTGSPVTTYANTQRRDAQNGQRSRGLSLATLTRNYFLTDIPFDIYNTADVTVARGPNALLFGIGSPGGIINNTLKQASSVRNFGEATVTLGERGSHREVFDYNAVIKKNRLAIRLVGLNDDMIYQQQPTYRKDRRYYGAIDAMLLQNKNSRILGPTLLRANFEKGDIVSNPPNVVPPGDAVSQWFSLPQWSPDLVKSLNDGVLPAALAFMTNGTFVSKATLDNRFQSSFPNLTTRPDIGQIVLVFNSPSAQRAGIGGSDPSLQGLVGVMQYNLVNPRVLGINQAVTFQAINPISLNHMVNYTLPVVMDKRILDNERILLAGNLSRIDENFDATTIALEQQLLNGNAGIEASFDKQKHQNVSILRYSNQDSAILKVDINQYLPDLSPNPNVGRLFMNSAGNGDDDVIRTTREQREAYQLNAFYKLDFTKHQKWKWLGSHTFTGLHSAQRIDLLASNQLATVYDIPGNNTNLDLIQNGQINGNGNRGLVVFNYMTDSLLGSQYKSFSDVRLNQYITSPGVQAGERYKIMYQKNRGAPTVNPATGGLAYYDEFEGAYVQKAGGSSHTFQKISSDVVRLAGAIPGWGLGCALWDQEGSVADVYYGREKCIPA